MRVVVGSFVFLALLTGSATQSPAQDQLVSGHKLLMRAAASGREKTLWVSKGPEIVADDPTTTGAILEIVAGTGETEIFDLPASGWAQRGRSFVFRNAAAPAGPSPVKVASLRDGLV